MYLRAQRSCICPIDFPDTKPRENPTPFASGLHLIEHIAGWIVFNGWDFCFFCFSKQLRPFKSTLSIRWCARVCVPIETERVYVSRKVFQFGRCGNWFFFQLHKIALYSSVTHSGCCSKYTSPTLCLHTVRVTHNFQLNKILTTFPRTRSRRFHTSFSRPYRFEFKASTQTEPIKASDVVDAVTMPARGRKSFSPSRKE